MTTMASVHPGLKTIPTCTINLRDSELELVATHAFLVDADRSQLLAKICTFSPNPSGRRMLNSHAINSEEILTFPIPGKQRSRSLQWLCLC